MGNLFLMIQVLTFLCSKFLIRLIQELSSPEYQNVNRLDVTHPYQSVTVYLMSQVPPAVRHQYIVIHVSPIKYVQAVSNETKLSGDYNDRQVNVSQHNKIRMNVISYP